MHGLWLNVFHCRCLDIRLWISLRSLLNLETFPVRRPVPIHTSAVPTSSPASLLVSAICAQLILRPLGHFVLSGYATEADVYCLLAFVFRFESGYAVTTNVDQFPPETHDE